MITDPMHGPHWQLALVNLALAVAVMATALATDAYLTRRALRLVGLRSRPTYLAMGTGLLALAVGCFTAVARFDAHNKPPPADVFGFIGLLASWAAPLSLGRALTWAACVASAGSTHSLIGPPSATRSGELGITNPTGEVVVATPNLEDVDRIMVNGRQIPVLSLSIRLVLLEGDWYPGAGSDGRRCVGWAFLTGRGRPLNLR